MSEYALTPETPDDEVVDLFGAMVEDNGLPDSLWLILADLDDLNAAELESVAKFAGPVLQVVGLLLKRINDRLELLAGDGPRAVARLGGSSLMLSGMANRVFNVAIAVLVAALALLLSAS